MIKKRIHIVIVLLMAFGAAHTYGQNEETKSIQVLGSAGKQNIRLRWGPTEALDWVRLNRYGYKIERVTISRDNKLLPTPQVTSLTPEPIKPRPMNDWESISNQDDNAAIMAQALYGETFELTENYTSDIMQVVQKSQETEQRFSFALFAADQSFEVAQLAGLGFIDRTARKNEKYLYRIISQVPVDIEDIDPGFVYVGLADYTELPKVYDLEAIFGDKAVMLSWERENFDGIYNSFIVEKSTDLGKTYNSITKTPVINTFKGTLAKSRRAYKLDSLQQNDKIYYYRIRGKTAFGEFSPPSDSVSGSGFTPIGVSPNMIRWETENNIAVDLEWNFESNQIIDGFRLERSRIESGPYQMLKEFKPDIRSFKDTKPMATNYYRITAFKGQSIKTSFPVLVQLEDSIPPSSPVGLVGKVDSLGVVAVNWKANTEQDLLGYRVYRSNFKNSEFVQVTEEAFEDTDWVDSINVKTLTSSIYYKITAIDFRFNESEPSEVMKLIRPDIIPPVVPVFKSIKSVDTGIELSYTNSTSIDVQKHVLYRKGVGEENWSRIGEKLPADSTVFIDDSVKPNIKYGYTIVAIDSSGLESKPAVPVIGSFIQTMTQYFPQKLRVKVDRNARKITLDWKFEGVAGKFKIYRQYGDEKLSLYKTLEGEELTFEDTDLKVGRSYKYGVQAVMSDGMMSKIVLEQVNY